MYYLKDYAQEHKVEGTSAPDDAQISRMFSELREEDRMLFFREWMKVKKPKEYVAYDVTSVSSYSKGIEDLEWGYKSQVKQNQTRIPFPHRASRTD